MDFSGKNVLIILHQGNLGGAERQALQLSKYLSFSKNCNVDLLLTSSPRSTIEFDLFTEGCNLRNIIHVQDPFLNIKKEFSWANLKNILRSLGYIQRLRKKVGPLKPDIIIPFLNYPSKVGFLLYKIIPSVKFTFWHQLGLDTLSYDLLERYVAQNTPAIIANAPNGLDTFKIIYKRKKEDLFVLPQYVSLEYIAINPVLARKKLNISKNAIVIGMVAHYRPEKLHTLLIDSFSEILESSSEEVVLVLLGNHNNSITTKKIYCSLKSRINEKKLNRKILLLSGNEVPEILNVMDIGVLVSETEGMPNAVMEYMLYGLPVIATRHPGCLVLLKDSEFLIENSKPQLVTAIQNLVASKELREKEAKLNNERIKQFNIDGYVEALTEIMNKKTN
jgi:glycosyltransferase involved in cell wall biosynthesis